MSILFNIDVSDQFSLKSFQNQEGRLRVLLVLKKTRFENYQENKDKLEKNPDIDDIKEMQAGYDLHVDSIKKICAILQRNNVDYLLCPRGELDKKFFLGRIIITIGGDGTLLEAAHDTQKNPLLGVNSDPVRSVGSLCLATSETFELLFGQILSGRLSVKKVMRIAGYLNGHKLPIEALNEVLIAHENPAAMSRYTILIDEEKEFQKSSGVWIAASSGSSGAIVSAGGEVRPIDDQKMQIVVREPYFSQAIEPKFLFGFVGEQKTVTIISHMQDGCIYFDGPMKKFPFVLGSRLDLKVSDKKLYLFVTKEMEERRMKIGRFRENYHRQVSVLRHQKKFNF
jgi:NAD+ kinase